MRTLNTRDLFGLARVLKSLGLRDKVRTLAKQADKPADIWDRGFDLVFDLLEAAVDTGGEKELYRFFAGPLEMTPAEVETMPLPDFLQALRQLAKENDLLGFFASLKRLMR